MQRGLVNPTKLMWVIFGLFSISLAVYAAKVGFFKDLVEEFQTHQRNAADERALTEKGITREQYTFQQKAACESRRPTCLKQFHEDSLKGLTFFFTPACDCDGRYGVALSLPSQHKLEDGIFGILDQLLIALSLLVSLLSFLFISVFIFPKAVSAFRTWITT